MGTLPNLSLLSKFALDNLIQHISDPSMKGKKDLMIDAELMKPLDRICGVSTLKKHGVDKIFRLTSDCLVTECEQRIFLARPYVKTMKLIADNINNDKKNNLSKQYKVLLTPKRLSTCDLILEKEGIYGDVTIDEFPLDLIVLDDDLISMEMPLCYKQFFLEQELTWFHTVARSLSILQGTYGTISHITGIGQKAQMLHELLTLMMSDEREFVPQGGPEIGSLIILDRDVDLVSMMCSQLTYEGLLADVFGVKSGVVELGKEVTGTDQKARLTLNASDKVFTEIRGLHVTSAFPLLSKKAKELQTGYDRRNQLDTVRDLKQFVSEDLKALKLQHKALALHIGACEAILKKKTVDNFEECLHTEQCLLDDTETKESISYIETCINRQLPATHCLRLMCLLSLCRGGLDGKLFSSLKTQFLQSFGYHHVITFTRLADLGLFTENTDKRNVFPKVKKKFNLIPNDPGAMDTKNPTNVSYVFGGAYSPFAVKLVEQIVERSFLQVEDALKTFGIPCFEHKKPVSVRAAGSATQVSSQAAKTALVLFLGGCSHTELNALRFVGKQLGHTFIVMTTSMCTAEELLETVYL